MHSSGPIFLSSSKYFFFLLVVLKVFSHGYTPRWEESGVQEDSMRTPFPKLSPVYMRAGVIQRAIRSVDPWIPILKYNVHVH